MLLGVEHYDSTVSGQQSALPGTLEPEDLPDLSSAQEGLVSDNIQRFQSLLHDRWRETPQKLNKTKAQLELAA